MLNMKYFWYKYKEDVWCGVIDVQGPIFSTNFFSYDLKNYQFSKVENVINHIYMRSAIEAHSIRVSEGQLRKLLILNNISLDKFNKFV